MRIGSFEFSDYAADKPLTVSLEGSFLLATEVVKLPDLGIYPNNLPVKIQKELTLDRYQRERGFILCLPGEGTFSKSELLDHIQSDTALGRLAVETEIHYCRELMNALHSSSEVKFPADVIPRSESVPAFSGNGKTALFLENTTDEVTSLIASYRIERVHPVFKRKGFDMVTLSGKENTGFNFRQSMGPASYISGVGHGKSRTFKGFKGERLLRVGKAVREEAEGKIIHLLGCRTASKLGHKLIDLGAKCFLGYDHDFVFISDQEDTLIQEPDLFSACACTFDFQMASEFSSGEAYIATVKAFNKAIASVPGTVTASWLMHNRDHLKLLGDPQASIF